MSKKAYIIRRLVDSVIMCVVTNFFPHEPSHTILLIRQWLRNTGGDPDDYPRYEALEYPHYSWDEWDQFV